MKSWRAITLLLAVTLATFSPILRNEFVSFDDPETIRDNPNFNPPTLEGLGRYWRTPAAGLYVPLAYTFWWLLAQISLNPIVYHAASVALHFGGALVVFELGRKLFHNGTAAVLGALIFAAHPVQVETVAWASGAKDLLAGLFAFAFVCLHLDGRFRWSIAALVAGMLCKPVVVVAPAIALVIDVLVRQKSLRDALRTLAPPFLLTIPCVIWSRIVQPSWPATMTPLWQRPLIAGDALAFYLRQLVWPATLTNLYGRTPWAIFETGAAYFAWTVPVFTAIAVALSRKRLVIAAGLIFVVGVLPVLGFTPFSFQIHSTVADHYLYIPMLGVALLVASIRPSRIVISITSLIIVALAIRSFVQTMVWHDSVRLFSHAVQVNPDSPDARGSLANALAEAGRVSEAVSHYEFVVSESPNSRIARQRLAQAYIVTDRFAEAIPHAAAALEMARIERLDSAWEHYLLGKALAGAGRNAEALIHLSAAADMRPDDPRFATERDALRARLDSPTTRQ